ncbi:MAG: hypothetical protein HYT71_01805 [Candidatus Aenigmarchaeota archaeon]|nr:hypothetical protein [Candidatus Aenigmarchaeota archaeon]
MLKDIGARLAIRTGLFYVQLKHTKAGSYLSGATDLAHEYKERARSKITGEKPVIGIIRETHSTNLTHDAMKSIGFGHGITKDKMKRYADDPEYRIQFWSPYISAVRKSTVSEDEKTKILHNIREAYRIWNEEIGMVESRKPSTLYMEGSENSIPSPLWFTAERLGIRAVMLDEDHVQYNSNSTVQYFAEWVQDPELKKYFKEYVSEQRKALDDGDFGANYSMQFDREDNWVRKVLRNPPRGYCMAIVGANHVDDGNKTQHTESLNIGSFERKLGKRGIKTESFDVSGFTYNVKPTNGPKEELQLLYSA